MITTYNYVENENKDSKSFKIPLPPESCGVLLTCAHKPADIGKLSVIISKQDTAEDGDLAAVVIDNEQTARIVLYNRLEDNQIVLLDPNKFESKYPFGYHYNPDKQGDDHIILTAAEAATCLKILGVVDKIAVYTKKL